MKDKKRKRQKQGGDGKERKVCEERGRKRSHKNMTEMNEGYV